MRTHYVAPKLALFVLALSAPACVRSNPSTPDDPTVDRSDGAIPSVRARHVANGAITLDGVLDEPAWRGAESTGRFVHPGNGSPERASRVQGAARFVWSDEGLYLGVTVYDSDPVQGFGARPPSEPDPHVWERSSAVELMLQPGDQGDNRDYFELQLDTAGALWDTRFDDYNRPVGPGPDGVQRFGHQEWVSNLRHGVRVDRARGRYTMEWLLPWSSLTNTRVSVPPRAGDVWRANLYSFRDGQRDSLAWSPIRGQGNFHRAARFGRLTFAE